ncbi:hypothetical protein [Thiothrix nivea]|uniref:Uncharacterized protein n=1 Tax=Thiothrix nivea (strain ATCC 35100 / DSM 5205 / JP2) TaxID=870187 RepID=A0A656HJ90_THINJ|nr:hypothetical protein [Thiothrix nivea]EIJ35299.1 hypothetical protein Thini_2762 [Thiothrix nivea DSM 5205]
MSNLFDDMDKQQFLYHQHFDNYIERVYENGEENSLKRMNHLWPTAYKDIYLSDRKIGPFTVNTGTGEIIRDARYPVAIAGTLKTQQKEKLKGIPIERNNRFKDMRRLGDFLYRNKYTIGVPTALGALGLGLYSSRKVNFNDSQ